MIANAARAVVVAALVVLLVTGYANVWIVLASAFLYGIAEVFADSAGATLMPMLVRPADLGIGNARMQAGHDQLHARNAFLGMDIHRHAAAVVGHFDRTVRVHHYVDDLGVTGQCFVDGIVDDFLRQMVRARGVGVHAGAAFDGFEAGKDFDIGGVVAGTHSGSASWLGRR